MYDNTKLIEKQIMTPLDKALVIYAEAKGYAIEVEYLRGSRWSNKAYGTRFEFDRYNYRIKNKEDYDVVLNKLLTSITTKTEEVALVKKVYCKNCRYLDKWDNDCMVPHIEDTPYSQVHRPQSISIKNANNNCSDYKEESFEPLFGALYDWISKKFKRLKSDTTKADE